MLSSADGSDPVPPLKLARRRRLSYRSTCCGDSDGLHTTTLCRFTKYRGANLPYRRGLQRVGSISDNVNSGAANVFLLSKEGGRLSSQLRTRGRLHCGCSVARVRPTFTEQL